MTKPLSETPITTRNARSKLPPGLHWKGIDTGFTSATEKAGMAGRGWYAGGIRVVIDRCRLASPTTR